MHWEKMRAAFERMQFEMHTVSALHNNTLAGLGGR